MGALRPFAEGLVISILFGLFIITFTVLFLNQTNPDSEVISGISGGFLNNSSTSFSNSINNFSSTANDFKTELATSKPGLTSFLFLIFEGAFTIPLAFLTLVYTGAITFVSVLFGFGGGGWGGVIAIATSTILAILLIRLILYIIKTIRTGESER
jgi:type IV secretory pathway VirB6-like protein